MVAGYLVAPAIPPMGQRMGRLTPSTTGLLGYFPDAKPVTENGFQRAKYGRCRGQQKVERHANNGGNFTTRHSHTNPYHCQPDEQCLQPA